MFPLVSLKFKKTHLVLLTVMRQCEVRKQHFHRVCVLVRYDCLCIFYGIPQRNNEVESLNVLVRGPQCALAKIHLTRPLAAAGFTPTASLHLSSCT